MKWERSSCVFAPRKAAVYLLLMGSLSCEQREFPPEVTLRYGQEVSIGKEDRLKLVGVWDSRADSVNTTYVYPYYNFGVRLQWVDAKEEFGWNATFLAPDGIGQGSALHRGYRFYLRSVRPAPRKNIPLQEYEVTLEVEKQ